MKGGIDWCYDWIVKRWQCWFWDIKHFASLRHYSLRDEATQPIVDAGAFGSRFRNSHSRTEDLLMQCAGMLANSTENRENQVSLVEAYVNGICNGIINLIRWTRKWWNWTGCCLAIITANEDNHVTAFEQGALNCFVALTNSYNDILLLIWDFYPPMEWYM
jgi:hypothetical protein